jgi:hypothetical protein
MAIDREQEELGDNRDPETKRQQLEALERSFKQFHARLGKRNWRRDDLYDRPSSRHFETVTDPAQLAKTRQK